MDTNIYEGYIRPHMADMQRHAERHRLAATVAVPLRVRLGRLLIRTGERLLRSRTISTSTTHQRKAIS